MHGGPTSTHLLDEAAAAFDSEMKKLFDGAATNAGLTVAAATR
jgi:hypothetical protein